MFRSSRTVPALLVLCAGLLVTPAAARQGPASVDTFALRALSWRLIGPFRSGRSVAVAGSDRRPLEYWSGTTGGGVMKTTNGGYTWQPMSDKYFGGTIGGIAVYQPNPDVVYVGGGEYTLRGNVSHGDGVFRTTDGGATWDSLGLADTRQISRVIVHPWNPDVVYVAALGHATGPNAERGVYRSKDGGKSWDKVLFVNDSVGVADLQMDPTDPNVLYAAAWRVLRRPWDLVSGGPGSGIYKSTDGGDHWTDLSGKPGLPKAPLGNIGLAVSPVDHQLVWAMIESEAGGLFRSTDGGATWTRVNDTNQRSIDGAIGIHWRPWYFSKVIADPKDPNTVYLPNGVLFRSTDGGTRFTEVRPYDDLWDTHALWISPSDPDRMIVGADQGARISVNRGANWSTTGYATGQFYHLIATNHFPYRLCGAQQDNSASCGPSRTDGMFDISAWYYPGGGESGMIAVDPGNPDVTYAPSEKVDRRRGLSWYLPPSWERPAPPAGQTYRWNWTTPIIASIHQRNTLYQGANVLFKSTDGGENWTPISPDLTRHDPATLVISGRPITVDNSGAENFATIFAIAESPVARGTIWTGSDDGKVFLTRDGGGHWRDVSPELPDYARISMIEASPHTPGTAYVAANRNKLDDYTPYLLVTTDYGTSWRRITVGIPPQEFARVIREDPVRRGLLFAGTERGVWFSLDAGEHWQSLRRNLPRVPVRDLVIKEGDLAIATHGRAMWILDDISPLRQLAGGTTSGKAHLFTPAPAYRISWQGQQLIQNLQTGQNPPGGASIYYWLAEAHPDVTLVIRDNRGAVVNRFSSLQDSLTRADSLATELKKSARNDSLRRAGVTDSATLAAPYVEPPNDEPRNRLGSPERLPAEQGLNRFGWTFRYQDGIAIEDSTYRLGRVSGPTATPGTYTIELTVGGVTERAQLTVRGDPRVGAGPADYAARLAYALRVNAAATELIESANAAARLRREVEQRLAAESTSAAAAALRAVRDTLVAFGTRAMPRWYRRNEGAPPYSSNVLDDLSRLGGDPNRAPNALERRALETMTGVARTEVARLHASLGPLVTAANAALRAAGQAELMSGRER
ncbi:MAG: WD40/YVTN/BNR-like repeat-containing protein [Gemmatimonadales bacterium]